MPPHVGTTTTRHPLHRPPGEELFETLQVNEELRLTAFFDGKSKTITMLAIEPSTQMDRWTVNYLALAVIAHLLMVFVSTFAIASCGKFFSGFRTKSKYKDSELKESKREKDRKRSKRSKKTKKPKKSHEKSDEKSEKSSSSKKEKYKKRRKTDEKKRKKSDSENSSRDITVVDKKKRKKSGETPPKPAEEAEVLKPRVFPLGTKEKKIAAGAIRPRAEYPTFADVKSDWGSQVDEAAKVAARTEAETKLEESVGDEPKPKAKQQYAPLKK